MTQEVSLNDSATFKVTMTNLNPTVSIQSTKKGLTAIPTQISSTTGGQTSVDVLYSQLYFTVKFTLKACSDIPSKTHDEIVIALLAMNRSSEASLEFKAYGQTWKVKLETFNCDTKSGEGEMSEAKLVLLAVDE